MYGDSPRRHTFRWLAAVIIAVGLLLFYTLVDPESGLMPRCVVRQLTGLSCPGCGLQRSLHALLNGEPAEALRFNYFLPVAILIVAVSAWLELTRKTHPERYRRYMHPACMYIILGLLILWTILRNIFGV